MWITKKCNCTCNGKQPRGIQCNTMQDKTKDRESPRRPGTQRSPEQAVLGRAQEDPKGSPRQGQRAPKNIQGVLRERLTGAQAWPQESSNQAPERSTGGPREAPQESQKMTSQRAGPRKCLLSSKRRPQRPTRSPKSGVLNSPIP